MTPEQWQRLAPYLDLALTMPEEERARWIDSLEKESGGLAAEVKSLLREHKELTEERFLDHNPLMGRTAGAYTLIAAIGDGGMSSVWLGERNDGRFERRAAIKFLNIALADRGEDRFRREGTILARLAHPHIAQLLDAGISEANQPYLVLEYVDGGHIDEYCDSRRLDVDARIRLFLDVLSAVAYAHANLIVHRDLKPSNVLVTEKGQVKLLDFGIAKLLEEGAGTRATQLTREGGAALTPYYAAPEQLTGQPITTATDVYALGVLLYLLLTGEHPLGSGRQSPAELVQSILDSEPPLLSAAALDAHVARCATTPERLRRQLRGDLDTIVAKALKKNPQERYASATELADDLRRYLRHEPIWARPDSVAYRTGKFLRRYATSVAAVSVTVAALAIGLAVAAHERNVAEARYRDVRDLAKEIFTVERDIRTLPGATAARERIVKTSLHYLESLTRSAGNDLGLKAEIAAEYQQVADVQGVFRSVNLGRPEEARESLVKAETLLREIARARPQDPQPLRDLINIVDLQSRIDHGAMNLPRLSGRVSELQTLLAAYEPKMPHDETNWSFLANIYDSMATASGLMSQLNQARSFAQRSTEYRRHVAEGSKSVRSRGNLANSLSTFASISRKTGRVEEAAATENEAIDLLQGILAEQPTHYVARLNLANNLLSLGRIYGETNGPSLGRRDDAIATIERSVALGREIMATDANDELIRYNHAVANIHLGNLLRDLDPAGALRAYNEAISSVAALSKSNSPKVVWALALAESTFPLRKLRRDEEARQRLRQAAQISQDLRKVAASAAVESEEAVSRAEAEWAISRGDASAAAYQHRNFLAFVDSIKPPAVIPAESMIDAFSMTRRYRLLEQALTAGGQEAEAKQADRKREDIFEIWRQRLPGSPATEALLRQ